MINSPSMEKGLIVPPLDPEEQIHLIMKEYIRFFFDTEDRILPREELNFY